MRGHPRHPATEPSSDPAGSLVSVALAVCLIGIAVPLLACVAYEADFLDLANESTAYRYFFAVRVANGETVVVGVGYLLAAIQQSIYAVIRLFDGGPDSLRQQVQGFALATNIVLTGGMAALIVLAFRDPLLRDQDRWLVAIVAFVPVWATRVTGFDYAIMADYHLLNLVLVTGSTWVFLREWRRSSAGPWRGRVFLLGMGLGIAMANKVTLAVVGAPALVPTLMASPAGVGTVAKRSLVAAGGAVSGFLAVIVASYRLDIAAVGEMLPVWTAFMMNPGGERQFWTTTFTAFVLGHGYAAIAVFFCFAVGAFLRRGSWRTWTFRERALAAVVGPAAVAAAWFVLERPAGSTLFESSVFLLALGTMMLGATRELESWVIPTAAAGWLIWSAATFAWHESFDMVRQSDTRAELKWAHYDDVRRLAAGRPITIVFPDNSYHHEGVFEFLLKGAVEFPTWHIGDRGRRLLERYSPGVSYRHDLGGPSPDQPYESGTVIVWYVSETADPVAKYKTLARSIGRCASAPREWTLEGKAGQTRVVGRACVVNDAATS